MERGRAAIFISPHITEDDGKVALEAQQWALRRGYQISNVVTRNWRVVEWHLVRLRIDVVVYADPHTYRAHTYRAELANSRHVTPDETMRLLTGDTRQPGQHRAEDSTALETVIILDCHRPVQRAQYATALQPTVQPRLPRGDDGGFAERFLEGLHRSRHMSDT